jgi:thiol-disulfide isomerase/thioredoxin
VRTFLRSVLLVAVLTVSGCGLEQDISERVQTSGADSQMAPALKGTTLTGTTIDLRAMRGHPVVVDFWASWCGPCRREQPELNAMYERYAARGVRFLGVDIRDDAASAQAFVTDFHIRYPSLFDPSGDSTGPFDVTAPPTTLVIDQTGRIRLRELGTLVDIPSTLSRLLDGPSP